MELNDDPSAVEAQELLMVLNGLFHAWELDSLVFTTPIIPPAEERGAYAHSDWVLNDTFPFEEGYVLGLKAILAEAAAEFNKRSLSPKVRQWASDGLSRLIADFYDPGKNQVPLELQRLGQSGVGLYSYRNFTHRTT